MLLYFSDLWSLGLVNKPRFPHILPKLTEHQSTEIQRSQCTLPVNPAFAKSVYKGKGYLFQNVLKILLNEKKVNSCIPLNIRIIKIEEFGTVLK